MAYNMPATRNGFNMYDCASYLQKACRRGLNEDAGFAACEMFGNFNTVMWNRMTFISSEDCCGAFTKELVKLRHEDEIANAGKKGYFRDTSYVSKAIYLLTHSAKSRDACYFACNFIIATKFNNVNKYEVKRADIHQWKEYIDSIPESVLSYEGMIAEDNNGEMYVPVTMECLLENAGRAEEKYMVSKVMRDAIFNNDMEAIGRCEDLMRFTNRKFLWKSLYAVAKELGGKLCKEIIGLYLADDKINGKRPKEKKDEIFASKAIMLLCYQVQGMDDHLISQECVKLDSFTDFTGIEYPNILDCGLKDGVMPEWVFDCHTIRGKQAGKNDWQMNVDEQAALNPLKVGFFDEGTWQSLYEWLLCEDRKNPGKFLSKGEYEEHFAYREGRYNNPITMDGEKPVK